MRVSRRAVRWLTASASSARGAGVLLPLNGVVALFETGDEVRERTGFGAGDRVRSYAGAKIGQLGIVVGLRNDALWIKWDGSPPSAPPSAYAYGDVPRIDLRVFGSVSITGLDAGQYAEGDQFSTSDNGGQSIAQSEPVKIELDDASVQSLVNTLPSAKKCERSTELHNARVIRQAVEGLRVLHRQTERIVRLLTLESGDLPPLSSKQALLAAVHEYRQPGFDKPVGWCPTPVEALSKLLQDRVQAFDVLHRVTVYTEEFVIPDCVLDTSSSWPDRLKARDWARALPTVTQLDNPLDEEAELSRKPSTERVIDIDIGMPLSKVGSIIFTKVFPGVDVTAKECASSPALDLTDTGREWLHAALLYDEGPFSKLNSRGDFETLFNEKLRDGRSESRDSILTKDLQERFKALSRHVSVQTKGGDSLAIPEVALERKGIRTGVIHDEPWCREVVNSHHTISATKHGDGDFYGKQCTVTATIRPPSIDTEDIATRLLHQLSIFKGRHFEPSIPEADVFIPEGRYKYLSKACAVELYADADRKPAMLDAKGLDIYKTNAWHQPFNLTNESGITFANPERKKGGYFRKSVFFPKATPAPLG